MKTISFPLKKLTVSAVCLALCLVLPFLTGQIKEIGDSLLPMHFPVMLCGLLCGAPYGFFVGLIAPFFRSLLFSMPPMYPNAVWMALELAAYGLVIGVFYRLFLKKDTKAVLLSLLPALVAGRIVLAIAKAILLTVESKAFVLYDFFIGSVIDALPGILLQLIFLPIIMKVLQKIRKN